LKLIFFFFSKRKKKCGPSQAGARGTAGGEWRACACA